LLRLTEMSVEEELQVVPLHCQFTQIKWDRVDSSMKALSRASMLRIAVKKRSLFRWTNV
jgi:hypothetical protein